MEEADGSSTIKTAEQLAINESMSMKKNILGTIAEYHEEDDEDEDDDVDVEAKKSMTELESRILSVNVKMIKSARLKNLLSFGNRAKINF